MAEGLRAAATLHDRIETNSAVLELIRDHYKIKDIFSRYNRSSNKYSKALSHLELLFQR